MEVESTGPFLEDFPLFIEQHHVLSVPDFVEPFLLGGEHIDRLIVDQEIAALIQNWVGEG